MIWSGATNDLQLSVDKCSENQSQMPDALVHTLTVSD